MNSLVIIPILGVLFFVPSIILDNAVVNTEVNYPTKKMVFLNTDKNKTVIQMAGHQVPVDKGGIYDKHRSNPPLKEVKLKHPALDLSWFSTLKKERKDVGFITYSPNFYYNNSSISAIYTVDMDKIENLIPESVREVVKPISFTPGVGLIAITSYAYHYCDNGSYNELSVSIVTTAPYASNLGLISLMGEINDKSLWGYVLKLPVDTELARVRGVVGYNLPKWLIPIKYELDAENMIFNYYDEKGNFDFSMVGKRLAIKESSTDITRLNFINLDTNGRPTHGYSDVRAIKKASSINSEDIHLNLSNGPLSRYIKSLGIKKLVRYDYQPEFQAALYTPSIFAGK